VSTKEVRETSQGSRMEGEVCKNQENMASKKLKKRDMRKRSTTAEKMSKAVILHTNSKHVMIEHATVLLKC
jgi:hypothetical protein